jgi:hypothetical protein
LAKAADDLDDEVGDLGGGRDGLGLGSEEVDDAVGEFAGQEGVGSAEFLGCGEEGAADLVGLEGNEAAVALGNPGGRRRRRSGFCHGVVLRNPVTGPRHSIISASKRPTSPKRQRRDIPRWCFGLVSVPEPIRFP